MKYTEYQKNIILVVIDLLKKGAKEIKIMPHVFGGELIIKGFDFSILKRGQ